MANEYNGIEIVEWLLARDSNIEITEATVAAAARALSGKTVIEVMLARDRNISITEPALAAAVVKYYSGKEVIEFLLATTARSKSPSRS